MNDNLVDEIIDDLQGTCKSLDEVLEDNNLEIDDLSMEELGYLDDSVFCCDYCGWWCETCELSIDIEDGQVCEGCEEDWKELTLDA